MRKTVKLLPSLTLLLALAADAAPVTSVDRIIALVNNDVIMQSELESELSPLCSVSRVKK